MIVLDTSILYSTFNEEDLHDNAAQSVFKRIFQGEYAQPVLLDFVYNELLTLIYVRTKKIDLCIKIADLLNDFIEANHLTMMHTPSEIFWKANELFFDQKIGQGRFLSFTDAIIGAMALWLNATYIATFDGQFHQFPLQVISE